MPVSFGVIRRLALFAAAVVGVAAVLLGRYVARPRRGSRAYAAVRSPALPLHGGLNNHLSAVDKCDRSLIDRRTGDVLPCTIPTLNGFDLLGCSPWRDGAGQFHLAVRYEETDGKGATRRLLELGLARCTYPERRVLDRVMLDPLPLSRVCWYADRDDTIIYAAADGQLYRYAFSEGENEKCRDSPLVPHAIRWEVASVNAERIWFRDLCWPANPALGGRLIAALSFCEESSPRFSDQHLWWLQLSRDGEAIVAAGSMVAPEEAEAEELWDVFRLPAVGTTRAGLPLLAYLARVRGETTLDLWVAPIVVGGTAGVPGLRLSTGSKVAEGCAPLEPVFSSRGRWIHAAVWERTLGEISVKRFAVASDEHRKPPGSSSAHSGGEATRHHSRRRAESD